MAPSIASRPKMSPKRHHTTAGERELMVETHAALGDASWASQVAAYNSEAERRGWHASFRYDTFKNVCTRAEMEDGAAKVTRDKMRWEEWEDVEVRRFGRLGNRPAAYKEFLQHMRETHGADYFRTLSAFLGRFMVLTNKSRGLKTSPTHKKSDARTVQASAKLWEGWENKELKAWVARNGKRQFSAFVEHVQAKFDPEYNRSGGVRTHFYRITHTCDSRKQEADSNEEDDWEDVNNIGTSDDDEQGTNPSSDGFFSQPLAKRQRVDSIVSETDSSIDKESTSAAEGATDPTQIADVLIQCISNLHTVLCSYFIQRTPSN